MRAHHPDASSDAGSGCRHLITVVAGNKREGSSPTGAVGRSLARRLLATGDRVRVLVEPEQRQGWPPSVEIVDGSITSPTSFAEAAPGTDTLFLAGAHPATVSEVLRSAVDAQVRRVVLLSSHGSEYEEAYPAETWFWLAIETAVPQSGIPATIIRPSAVMGSMIEGSYPATGSGWPEMIKDGGVILEPYAAAGHYPFIHEDDLAAVAAAALRSHTNADTYAGQVLEAVGPPVSTRARAAAVAAALGRRIGLVEVTADDARSRWRAHGWPDEAIDVTLYALEEYGRRLEELTRWTSDQRPAVTEIIGRRLRSYEDWAREHVHLFR